MKIDKFKIKELMSKNKINTQAELAEKLGISKNQVSNILSDKFNPIKSNVIDLANFFGVDPIQILTNQN